MGTESSIKKSVTQKEKATSDDKVYPETKMRRVSSKFQVPPGFDIKKRNGSNKIIAYITPTGVKLSSRAKVLEWVAKNPNYLIKQEVGPDPMEIAGMKEPTTEYESQSLAPDYSEAKAAEKKK